jgi:hypothetical protein
VFGMERTAVTARCDRDAKMSAMIVCIAGNRNFISDRLATQERSIASRFFSLRGVETSVQQGTFHGNDS